MRKWSCGTAKEAVFYLLSHQRCCELRLEIGGSLYSSVVSRNNEQILTTQEQRRTAMVEKGWS
jgi:hypothetical protein